MNGLLKINYETEQPTVSARELHEGLEINTRFNDWFSRMTEYGFENGKDFYSKMSKTSETGGRPAVDYQISIDMAKQICMIQRNEKGRQYRQYFLDLEKSLEHTGTDLCPCFENGRPADETERSVCGCRQRVEHLYPDRGAGKDIETKWCRHRTEQTVHMDA